MSDSGNTSPIIKKGQGKKRLKRQLFFVLWYVLSLT